MDLSRVDLGKIEVSKSLKDAAYIGVGFGVLAFQRAMVLRQDLRKELEVRLAEAQDRVGRLVGTA